MKKSISAIAKRIILLVVNTVVIFSVYYVGTSIAPTTTMIIYTTLFAGFAFSYVIYNRGFSRKGITIDKLPDEWPPEKKTDFIDDGKRRLEKSKWMLMVLLPMIFVYGCELCSIYLIPVLQNHFG